MEETFQFHPRRTIEGSVSRIAKWIPVRSALVEEFLAAIELALQRVGQCSTQTSRTEVIHWFVYDPTRVAKSLQIVTPRALWRPHQAPELKLEDA